MIILKHSLVYLRNMHKLLLSACSCYLFLTRWRFFAQR